MTQGHYQRTMQLPRELEKWLLEEISEAPPQLPKWIKELSDHFQGPRLTPWDSTHLTKAYLTYFFPLNVLRLMQGKQRLDQVGFFDGIQHIVDVGSGPGSLSFAWGEHSYKCHELNEKAVSLHKGLNKKLNGPKTSWIPESQLKELCGKPDHLMVFSYSLNEFDEIPKWLFKSKNLLIIEPSTQQESRKLLELRERLLEKTDLNIWAPCTHMQNCPLLKHSKKDFCHDRVHIEMPEEWKTSIERHLPMKNKTLTMSYLALREQEPTLTGYHRLTGDLQRQKGKAIQLICRSEKREFLTWMGKKNPAEEIPRGLLVRDGFEFEEKSNELRVTSAPETLPDHS